jgi:hypothetical protein
MIMAQYLTALAVMLLIDVTMVLWDKNDFTKQILTDLTEGLLGSCPSILQNTIRRGRFRIKKVQFGLH